MIPKMGKDEAPEAEIEEEAPEAETEADLEAEAFSTASARCMMRFVQSARKSAKYHSSQEKTEKYSAKNATCQRKENDSRHFCPFYH